MKNKTMHIAALATTGFALLSFTATAATVLLNEDFENPDRNSNTRVINNPTASQMTFAGWDFVSANTFNMRQSGDAGGEGAAGNQQLQFEWTGTNASYDTSHTWSADDEFSLSFNATEQSWNSVRDRFIVVEIVETVSDITLWSGFVELPEYDGVANAWTAAQTFDFNFAAADFTGGTEGSAITFEIGQLADGLANATDPGNVSSLRGAFVDNINLTFVPEPTSTALIGLGGLVLILRRRK